MIEPNRLPRSMAYSLAHSLVKRGRYIVAFSLCLFAVEALAVKESQPQYPGSSARLPPSSQISYANATDLELKSLGEQWATLSAPERRALLAEVRMRWARDHNGSTRVRIQATRQFGVVRQPDGTTIRVERRIIRMFPVDDEKGYGTGFEQRVGNEPGTPEQAPKSGFIPEGPQATGAPAMRVRAGPDQQVPGSTSPASGTAPATRSNR
jgi:hypothetical protein